MAKDPSVHQTKTTEDHLPSFTLPEWETPDRSRTRRHAQIATSVTRIKQTISAIFNQHVPNNRKYCGFSRRLVLSGFIAAFLLLALILGLAIGLSLRERAQHKDLPVGSKSYSGDLTYYGPGLGACGRTSSDSDDIVSISHFIFDAFSKGSDPNANPLCGHKLRAIRDGKSVDLTVVDRCVGCEATDIDVSPGAFKKLADPDLGRVTVSWAWLSPVPTI